MGAMHTIVLSADGRAIAEYFWPAAFRSVESNLQAYAADALKLPVTVILAPPCAETRRGFAVRQLKLSLGRTQDSSKWHPSATETELYLSNLSRIRLLSPGISSQLIVSYHITD